MLRRLGSTQPLLRQLPLALSQLEDLPLQGQQAARKHGLSTSSAAAMAEEDTADNGVPGTGEAARELGLDAVPLATLRELVADALPREGGDDLEVIQAPAKSKRLTYADIEGYQDVLKTVMSIPETYKMPKAPALDAGQWVDAHFKQAGHGLEPRSPFYVWRSWAATALPADQVDTLVALEQAMGDDTTRAALLKQAQHELARLWDWQHRRAALGLSPDLSPAAAAAAASSRQAQQAAAAAAEAEAAAAAAAAAADAQASLPAAVAAVDESACDDSGSSSDDSSSTQLPSDLSEKGMLEVLSALSTEPAEPSDADKFDETLQAGGGAGRAGMSWMLAIEDVVNTAGDRDRAAAEKKARSALERMKPNQVQILTDYMDTKVERGRISADRGKYRELNEYTLRKYQPVGHDDDLFLPSKPFGSAKIAAVLADPSRTQAVDPQKVTRQAVAIVEAARRAAAAAAVPGPSAAGAVDGAEWSSMPLLDRTVLHQEHLREAQQRLANKPKKLLPWKLLPLDSYTFDLEVRPPTAAFDLLTNYLEVKYADVLLRKDSVKTLQRQLALSEVLGDGQNPATATELLESPPAALTAAKTLSPAEREAVSAALDGLLEGKQYGQYRDAVLQLYCDGLITWGELQQCWAAAEAGEEMTAAAEAPVAFADDRQQLFGILSGQQQLGSLTSSSSNTPAAAPQLSAADEAAAKKLWDAAGSKLKGNWDAAAKAAHESSSSSGADAWAEPVSFEEAQRTWQQLLQLAGKPYGPRLEQVLLAGSGSSSDQDVLQLQLQQLQQALERATGLTVHSVTAEGDSSASNSSSSSGGIAIDNFDQLQQLFASPPSLEELLKQHWEQVSRDQLGKEVQWNGPTWQQLWQLLDQLAAAAQQQQLGPAADSSTDAADATAVFDQYLRETEVAPLTPPPYPGARRLLQWEQRMILGPTSGQTVMPAELKVKLSVSAAELQQETGLSKAGLQHMLAVAGSRYNPSTGMLTLVCNRFPTREENRRWCLEVLHRLLQEGQSRHPSPNFLLASVAGAASGATTAALP